MPHSDPAHTARAHDPTIQTLRGVAILALVAYHLFSMDPSFGVPIKPGSFFHALHELFHYIRMPLFTTVSGYVYAMRPVRVGESWEFLRKKTRRLLWPFFTLTTLAMFYFHFRGHGWTWRGLGMVRYVYIYPYAHLWYLQALSLIFLLVVLLERLGAMKSLLRWWWVFAAVSTAALVFDIPTMIRLLTWEFAYGWSLLRAVYLLPWFVLGLGVCRFGTRMPRKTLTVMACVMLAVGLGCQWVIYRVEWNTASGGVEEVRSIALLVGLSACYLLLTYRFRQDTLAWWGERSYEIYLFHVTGIYLARLGVDGMGFSETGAWAVTLGLCGGLLLPLVLRYAFRKTRWTRRIVLGMR
ncbi:MAG: acyltransferase family protein [Phycisphaera sp.]|nr:acyltransferase family protein [Phycisphaera sp.]